MIVDFQISTETTDILIEVTSSTNLPTCKKVMETTLQGMLEMGLGQTDSKSQAAQDSDDDGITFGGMFLQKVLLIDPMQFIIIDERSLQRSFLCKI